MNKRIVAIMLATSFLTGCNELFPKQPKQGVQDPSSICRATPELIVRFADTTLNPAAQLTNNTTVITGHVNGEDGIMEKATLCKVDGSGNLIGCQSATSTGVLTDGTTITFSPNNVSILMAVTNGYYKLTVEVDASCHG